jgi:hypothetical protein
MRFAIKSSISRISIGQDEWQYCRDSLTREIDSESTSMQTERSSQMSWLSKRLNIGIMLPPSRWDEAEWEADDDDDDEQWDDWDSCLRMLIIGWFTPREWLSGSDRVMPTIERLCWESVASETDTPGSEGTSGLTVSGFDIPCCSSVETVDEVLLKFLEAASITSTSFLWTKTISFSLIFSGSDLSPKHDPELSNYCVTPDDLTQRQGWWIICAGEWMVCFYVSMNYYINIYLNK